MHRSSAALTGCDIDRSSLAYLQCAELADTLEPERSPEAVLQLVSVAARIGAEFHCFRFADGLIENLALRVARTLPDLQPLPATLALTPHK